MNFQAPCLLAILAVSAIPSCSQPPAAPSGRGVNIPGTLELVDKPPAATPVEAMIVTIREFHGGDQSSAHPDRDGKFTLLDVPPGRYALNLGFPGRIRLFTAGSKTALPTDFVLAAGQTGPLRIVVSLKTALLSVDVIGIPDSHPGVVALLTPADPYLTLQQSSILNTVSGHATEFRYASPGSYTLLILDSTFQRVVSSSTALRNALKEQSTAVDVRDVGVTRITATYVTPDAVGWALASGRQLPDDFQRRLDQAERQILRLPPAAFPELPGKIVRELQSRGCTVPQESFAKKPMNVIKGQFAKPGQTDWAVLCSVKGVSTILVFWNGSPLNPAAIGAMEDLGYLQTVSETEIGYSRAITPVGRAFIMGHFQAYGGPTPPPIYHQGIDDAFTGKASVTLYFHKGKWLVLTGAD